MQRGLRCQAGLRNPPDRDEFLRTGPISEKFVPNEFPGMRQFRRLMPRFKLTIEYAGTRYSGWQIQKNARTIAGRDRAGRA